MHSIIPTKDGKVKAAEVSTRTFKEYNLSANAKASQSPKNINVSSSLQGYSTQPSSPVPVQYQVGPWVIVIKYEGKLFSGEIRMVIPDQVKVSIMIHHRTNLQKWPRKEDHFSYLNHNAVKAIQPPEMQKCEIRVFFKIKQMDQTSNLWTYFKRTLFTN